MELSSKNSQLLKAADYAKAPLCMPKSSTVYVPQVSRIVSAIQFIIARRRSAEKL